MTQISTLPRQQQPNRHSRMQQRPNRTMDSQRHLITIISTSIGINTRSHRLPTPMTITINRRIMTPRVRILLLNNLQSQIHTYTRRPNIITNRILRIPRITTRFIRNLISTVIRTNSRLSRTNRMLTTGQTNLKIIRTIRRALHTQHRFGNIYVSRDRFPLSTSNKLTTQRRLRPRQLLLSSKRDLETGHQPAREYL